MLTRTVAGRIRQRASGWTRERNHRIVHSTDGIALTATGSLITPQVLATGTYDYATPIIEVAAFHLARYSYGSSSFITGCARGVRGRVI